jgi:hypothetical protein
VERRIRGFARNGRSFMGGGSDWDTLLSGWRWKLNRRYDSMTDQTDKQERQLRMSLSRASLA